MSGCTHSCTLRRGTQTVLDNSLSSTPLPMLFLCSKHHWQVSVSLHHCCNTKCLIHELSFWSPVTFYSTTLDHFYGSWEPATLLCVCVCVCVCIQVLVYSNPLPLPQSTDIVKSVTLTTLFIFYQFGDSILNFLRNIWMTFHSSGRILPESKRASREVVKVTCI